MEVYKAINEVAKEMSKEGIAKGRKNQSQGYAFRGIDDVFAALAPHLSRVGLCILPRVIDRTVLERETKSGGNLFYTTLKVEFDFVAVADGSKHTVCTVGEAMDSGDKSSNKAMSAAYKYAAFQAFCIPTEGDNDADAHSHEVAPAKPAHVTTKPAAKPATSKDDALLRIELAKLLQPIADDANRYFRLFKDKDGKEISWLLPNETVADLPIEKVKLILKHKDSFMKAIQKAVDNVPM